MKQVSMPMKEMEPEHMYNLMPRDELEGEFDRYDDDEELDEDDSDSDDGYTYNEAPDNYDELDPDNDLEFDSNDDDDDDSGDDGFEDDLF